VEAIHRVAGVSILSSIQSSAIDAVINADLHLGQPSSFIIIMQPHDMTETTRVVILPLLEFAV
jgi:hypothetical protein